MATHRAEQIVVAVVAKLTGLTTTGTNVFRGQVYDLDEALLPALRISQGDDNPRSDGGSSSFSYIDGDLTIKVEVVVKTSAIEDTLVAPTRNVDTLLNKVRKEITIALQADVTQGLNFVMNTTEGNASEPEFTVSNDKPVGVLKTEWILHYRRSRTDPSA